MKVPPTSFPTISYKWLVTILSGVFMFLSLYVYRAYHIDEVGALTGHSMFFRAATHSLIISSVFYVIESYMSPVLSIREKFKPFVTALLATFCGLNLTFLAFNYFYQWTVLDWAGYFQFYYEYPLVLIIPVTLSYLIDRLSHHPTEEPDDRLISLLSENQKEHFRIKRQDLLFIKSADNYIEVFFISGQQVKKHLMRSSLKEVEAAHATSDFLVRCHRSYLVNRTNIDQVRKTNSKIELTVSGISIPVSKKYAKNFADQSSQPFTPHLENSPQIP